MRAVRCRLLALLTALVLTLALPACSRPGPGTVIKFNMGWLPQGSQAGVIVAIGKGFYRDAGLNVEAVRGFGGIRTANEVSEGLFEFGYADPVAVALDRANGGSARLIGVIDADWPGELCFLQQRHTIRAPAQLEGLTVGGGQNSPVQELLPVWLKRNGIDPATVRILQLNPSVIVASLVQGKIDAAECWLANSRPLFAAQAHAAGFTIDSLPYDRFNLDIYGSGLITSDRLIRDDPGLVARFVRATYRGYRYALEHPREAQALILNRYPLLNPQVTAAQIGELAQLMKTTGNAGAIDPLKMQRTYDFIASGYPLAGKVAVTDLYTSEFVTTPPQK